MHLSAWSRGSSTTSRLAARNVLATRLADVWSYRNIQVQELGQKSPMFLDTADEAMLIRLLGIIIPD